MEFDSKDFGAYDTNSDLESSEGVWLKFPGNRRIRILRAGGSNKAFARRYNTLIKPHRRDMDTGTLDPAISEQIMRQLYAERVVLGWENINTSDGTPVPCTVENVTAYLERFPEVLSDLIEYATEAATFVDASIEEAKDLLGKP